ncbi:MAG TPA: hypothetical protein VK052_02765 [Zeimonas sp.]|nr:hypothetical protein [Zeimonas sp.]
MNTTDRDGPPDGDFASYVERLTGNAGRTPGEQLAASTRRSRQAAVAGGTDASTPLPARPSGTPGEQLAEALRQATVGARRKAGPAGKAVDTVALRAAGRAVGTRVSRWLMAAGIALIVLSVFELVPRLSPLPGFALLVLSLFLRRLSAR